jgi:hypothetical protein
VNLCRSCGEDFGGVELFDRHRVGNHAYTFGEGLRRDPPGEDGRRCLDAAEMRELGWRLNTRGRWIDPARSLRAAQIESAERREPFVDMAVRR